jgi:hypothetical protein
VPNGYVLLPRDAWSSALFPACRLPPVATCAGQVAAPALPVLGRGGVVWVVPRFFDPRTEPDDSSSAMTSVSAVFDAAFGGERPAAVGLRTVASKPQVTALPRTADADIIADLRAQRPGSPEVAWQAFSPMVARLAPALLWPRARPAGLGTGSLLAFFSALAGAERTRCRARFLVQHLPGRCAQ